MNILFVIFWVVSVLLTVLVIFETVGMRLMVAYFPEGKRWWMLPAQLLSLVAFAILILVNPWGCY